MDAKLDVQCTLLVLALMETELDAQCALSILALRETELNTQCALSVLVLVGDAGLVVKPAYATVYEQDSGVRGPKRGGRPRVKSAGHVYEQKVPSVSSTGC